MGENKPTVGKEITKVLTSFDIKKAKLEFVRFMGALVLLPLSVSLSLGLLMYFLRGPLDIVIASLFIISFTGWVMLWVVKSLKAWEFKYRIRSRELTEDEIAHIRDVLPPQTALLIATKSMILYVLIVGYVAIAFAFACVYDALNVSSANTLLENFYFSITTLTTVGYGDFIPIGYGRFFASIEMIFGIVYSVIAIGAGATYMGRFNIGSD